MPSKLELAARLEFSGFGGQKWYYPITDHWFAARRWSIPLSSIYTRLSVRFGMYACNPVKRRMRLDTAEKSQTEQEIRNTKHESDRAIKKAQDNALRQICKVTEDAKRSIAVIERELVEEQAENQYKRTLNANLLRISKERANTDRSLNPKKKPTGYVAVMSADKEHRYKDGNRYW